MELVSLALGVLPVVGGAIKGSKIVRDKFQIFRHYSRELQRSYKQLRLQSQFFQNEIHLLLRPVVDEDYTIDLMLKDANHEQWRSQALDIGLRASLGKNHDICLGVIEDIQSTLECINLELECFEDLMDQRQPHESVTDAVRRLRGRITVSYNKPKLEQHFKDLRESNYDLNRLREQIQEIQRPNETKLLERPLLERPNQEFTHYQSIRQASRGFHEALQSAWSRTIARGTTRRLRHIVRLFLDMQVVEDVFNLNVVISCFKHGESNKHSLHKTRSSLQVRSLVYDCRGEFDRTSDLPNAARNNGDRRKTKRVRFQESSSTHVRDSRTKFDAKPIELYSENLCSVLCNACLLPPSLGKETQCLGYIDNPTHQEFRHIFYGSCFGAGLASPLMPTDDLVSMSDLLSFSEETSLSIVSQLQLAQDLVSAVLKFYSTPWLQEYFSLSDLSFFNVGQDLQSCLNTLHISSEFTQEPSQEPGMLENQRSYSRDLGKDATHVEHAKLQHGIRNLTLWSLGIILLQIGQWSKIEQPDDVVAVRRLASRISGLGPKYQALTRKCLECDFGYGEDLTQPRLQQAVYEGIACEIGGIISSQESCY